MGADAGNAFDVLDQADALSADARAIAAVLRVGLDGPDRDLALSASVTANPYELRPEPLGGALST